MSEPYYLTTVDDLVAHWGASRVLGLMIRDELDGSDSIIFHRGLPNRAPRAYGSIAFDDDGELFVPLREVQIEDIAADLPPNTITIERLP